MAERKAVTKQVALRYRKASRQEKGLMLSELCALTGWNRDYARRALREAAARPPVPRGQRRAVAVRKPRAPVYDEATIDALRVIWVLMDFPCGKRLQPVLADVVEALERHRELNLEPDVRSKLMAMSAATIDRRLAGDRKRFQIRGRTGPSRAAC